MIAQIGKLFWLYPVSYRFVPISKMGFFEPPKTFNLERVNWPWAGKYCIIYLTLCLSEGIGKNNRFFYDNMTFLPKAASFGDNKGQILKSLIFVHKFLTKTSFLTHLTKILKLTCKLVLFSSIKFKVKGQYFKFPHSGSTFVRENLQKRPGMPFCCTKVVLPLSVKWRLKYRF